MPEQILAALDVGTWSVKAVVAEISDGDPSVINVLGLGEARTEGARLGRVVNVPQVAEAVDKAVSEAELMSGIEVRRTHVSLSGGFLRSINRTGMAPVKRHEVTSREVDEVRRTATAMQMAADERPLAVVSQGFAVDDTPGVLDPLGMAAKCLYGRYHVVTFSEQAARNVRRCCERLELAVDGVHVEPLVSSEAVLDDDERELGVLVLDIGAGTTSVAAFRDGMLLHTGVIPIGGAHLTTDLAHGLKTPQGEAERLLETVGCVDETQIGPDETFDIPGLGGRAPRTLPRDAIVEVLQPRAEEILFAAARDLEAADVLPEDLAGGLVLTGGVASLQGLTELAAEVLGLPARLGKPRGFGGLNKVLERPDFAAAAGVLRRAARGEGHIELSKKTGLFRRFTSRVREMTVDYI